MSPCAFTQSCVSPSSLRIASASSLFAFTARYPCERAIPRFPLWKNQANVMPNKSDAPMQSRMVVIEFEPLDGRGTGVLALRCHYLAQSLSCGIQYTFYNIGYTWLRWSLQYSIVVKAARMTEGSVAVGVLTVYSPSLYA